MGALLIGPIFELIKQALSGLGLDPEAKARAQSNAFDILSSGNFADKAMQALAVAQIEVNKAEAATGRGLGQWRSALGWVLTAALAGQFVVSPWATWFAGLSGMAVPPFPVLDGVLWELLFGMLGLGTLHTVEKIKGVK